MTINLTWDLFIIVFFIVIIAYSFIIGRNQTLKIIISSYIAILAADGLGNIIRRYLLTKAPLTKLFSSVTGIQTLIILKIVIFVSTIVVLVTKGAFDVSMQKEKSSFISLLMTITFAILSAGLIVSTLLLYISGISVIEGVIEIKKINFYEIYVGSYFVRSMINNYSIWFCVPALAFIMTSFLNTED